MIPRSDADAPSVDRGVLARLKRLDPNLVVTWRHLAIDPLTDTPIECKGSIDPVSGHEVKPGPIVDPQYHLWRRDNDSGRYFWVSCYREFGHLQVLKLERDLARFEDPRDIARLVSEADKRRRDAAIASKRDDVGALTRANWRKIRDRWEGKTDSRGAKVVSAPGLSRRSTNDSHIPLSPKEAGWESNNN